MNFYFYRLIITPYLEPAIQTTYVPLLNNVFTGWISHVQSMNCAYFHLKEWHEEFPKRLQILYEFYKDKRNYNEHILQSIIYNFNQLFIL